MQWCSSMSASQCSAAVSELVLHAPVTTPSPLPALSVGGSGSLFSELLTEIERWPGICFLATNKADEIDESMYRRITAVYKFKTPTRTQRQRIWELHTAHSAIAVDESVDWRSV